MDIELYRTFLAVADSRSFTLAAQMVGRTQPAVSQQIKRLEAAIGRPLFERSSTLISLTEHGKSLLRPARSIVAMHTESMESFKRTSFAGNIVVGVADAYVNRILKDLTREFMALFPEAALSVVIDDSLGLSRRIADGTVDLAFVTEGNCPTRGPVAFRDRLVVVGPAHIDLSKADPLPVAIWDERNEDETPLSRLLSSMNRRYRAVFACRSVHAQHQAIASGLCVGVLVEGSMVAGERAYIAPGEFPVLKELNIRLERSSAKRSPAVARLAEHYLKHFSTH
jgi:DNA-binding transcriptional LysR family regulator